METNTQENEIFLCDLDGRVPSIIFTEIEWINQLSIEDQGRIIGGMLTIEQTVKNFNEHHKYVRAVLYDRNGERVNL